MLQTILEYQKLKESIPALLNVSGYRNDFLAKKIDMALIDFLEKKSRGNWTDNEVQNILTVLTEPNEEVEDYFMLAYMRKAEKDEIVTLAEYKKEMGWK